MTHVNGETDFSRTPLELNDVLHIRTEGGETLDFEVVGILQEENGGASYAVLWRDPGEGEEQFIVTDQAGDLLEDDELAQQILDDFLTEPEES